MLPVPKNLLEASGIKATVAERLSDHGKSSTRALAQQLIDCWEPKPAQPAPAAQPKAESASEGQPLASLHPLDAQEQSTLSLSSYPPERSIIHGQSLDWHIWMLIHLAERHITLEETFYIPGNWLSVLPDSALRCITAASRASSVAPGSAAPVSEDDDETELMDEQLLMMLDRQKEVRS